MDVRHIASAGLFGIAIVALAATPLLGQARRDGAKPPPAVPNWTPPRTPDGQPDLQGVWVNYDRTPFETPFEGGASRPPAELDEDNPVTDGRVGFYSQDWTTLTKAAHEARKSMVVDPPDGKVPLRASAEERRDYDAKRMKDSWVHQSGWERCITRGVPGGFFPGQYNAAQQIVQGPGYVAIIYEMIHEARIISLDGGPHLPAAVRYWNGDSRGRWDGNTLVVDVTNYNTKGNIATSGLSGRIRGVRQSESAHVVERFTRVGPDRIDYQVTIDDPVVYTRPWTVALPMSRDDSYKIYEYACHEGNHAMVDILRGGRVQDKAAEEAAKATGK